MAAAERVFVSRKQLAAYLNVSRRRIGQLVTEGKLKETDKGFDLEQAKADYAKNTDRSKVEAHRRRAGIAVVVDNPPVRTHEDDPRSGDQLPDLLNFNTAKAKKEHYNAERSRVDLEQRLGSLVPREEVKSKAFEAARMVRDRLLGFPPRLAGLVPPEGIKLLTDEIEQLIREFQEACAKIGI